MWRVLVVDDNFSNRKLILKILVGIADCDVAASGSEALEAYDMCMKEKRPYDIVLLDIAMPGMDGMEVLKKLREKEEGYGITKVEKKIPVIMVTAHREPFFDAFKEGCDDYINKPIRPEMLIERMERLLKNR